MVTSVPVSASGYKSGSCRRWGAEGRTGEVNAEAHSALQWHREAAQLSPECASDPARGSIKLFYLNFLFLESLTRLVRTPQQLKKMTRSGLCVLAMLSNCGKTLTFLRQSELMWWVCVELQHRGQQPKMERLTCTFGTLNPQRRFHTMMSWFMFVVSCSPVIATDSKSAGEWGREGKAAVALWFLHFSAFSSLALFCMKFKHLNFLEWIRVTATVFRVGRSKRLRGF